LVPEKSLGTGIVKIWYRKKVSEPVSEKFGTEKSTGIGIGNIWYRKKVSVSVSFEILGTVTHWAVETVETVETEESEETVETVETEETAEAAETVYTEDLKKYDLLTYSLLTT